MKAEYDFSKGKRGPILSRKGKTRITIYIDDNILDEFRTKAEAAGKGYQTMINDALREYLDQDERPVTEDELRRVLQEEFPKMVQP